MRRSLLALAAAMLGVTIFSGPAAAQQPQPQLPRFYYYPYYYYPHSYWPTNSPQWPEASGSPYQRPPAYMAYPPFLEKKWRYDLFESHKYYRGSHFWLDQF
ncbi:MAG: hypothetical protein K1X57_08730 [Gemmataceae bacterium]|nr:hypothetical protein [Gemmataceae bacterium]